MDPFILIAQMSYLDFPELGEGPLIEAIFPEKLGEDSQYGHLLPPVYEEAKESPFGCKVWEFTPEEFADPGLDQGTVEFEIDGAPPIPPCTFRPGPMSRPGGGYPCIGVSGEGGAIEVVDADAGLYSFTDGEVTFSEDDVGRHLELRGATVGPNNGDFPIVAFTDESTIHFRNVHPQAMAEELEETATYATLAGLGPAEQMNSLAEDTDITISFDPGGEQDLSAFSARIEMGESFTLDTSSQTTIGAIPMDGSGFTIGCSGEGGKCGVAIAGVMQIRTTDAAIDPELPPYVLPPPENKAVDLVCVVLAGRFRIPAEASAYLADSGATRIQVIFARANNAIRRQPNADINMVAGHAQSAFITVPPE